jgi:hypothetical protein
MTGKERDRLLVEWALNRDEFCRKLYRAGQRQDWQFLKDPAEAIRPRKPRGLHWRVLAAYTELHEKHGAKVTGEMIRELIDPDKRIPLQHFSRKSSLDSSSAPHNPKKYVIDFRAPFLSQYAHWKGTLSASDTLGERRGGPKAILYQSISYQ